MDYVSNSGTICLNRKVLVELRKSMGLSQGKMADLCKLNGHYVSLSTLKRAELGKEVLFRTAKDLACFFDVPLPSILPTKNHEQIKSNPIGLLNSTSLIKYHKRPIVLLMCKIDILFSELEIEQRFSIHNKINKVISSVLLQYKGAIVESQSNYFVLTFGYPHFQESAFRLAIQAGFLLLKSIPATFRDETYDFRLYLDLGECVVGNEEGSVSVIGKVLDDCKQCINDIPANALVTDSDKSEILSGLNCAYRSVGNYNLITCIGTHSRITEAEILDYKLNRVNEHDFLKKQWQLPLKGEGNAVLITGRSGIGKSFCIKAFKHSLNLNKTQVLEIQCSLVNQNCPYYVVKILIEKIITRSILHNGDISSGSRSVVSYVNDISYLSESKKSILKAILEKKGIFPIDEIPKGNEERLIQDAISAFFIHQQFYTHMLLILEDIQWIDTASFEVIIKFIDQIQLKRCLIIFSSRQSYDLDSRLNDSVATLRLDRLSDERLEQMLRNSVFTKTILSDKDIQRILSCADGVPLYAFEFAKSVLKAHKKDKDEEIVIPVSLRESLQFQIDCLSDNGEIVLAASVLGRIFSAELLAKLMGLSLQKIHSALDELVNEGLLVRVDSLDGVHLMFKHILIHKAAYNLLLNDDRILLHNKVIDSLESNVLSYEPQLWARHYLKANRNLEAVPHLENAGRHAWALFGFEEAAGYYQQAINAIKKCESYPEQKNIELHLSLALAFRITRGLHSVETENLYRKTLQLCNQGNGTDVEGVVLLGLWGCYIAQANISKSIQMAKSCYQYADKTGNRIMHTQAILALANSYFWAADIKNCRKYLKLMPARIDEETLELHLNRYGFEPRLWYLMINGVLSAIQGNVEESLDCRAKSIKLYQQSKHHPLLRILAEQSAAWISFQLNDTQNTLLHGKNLYELAKKYQFNFYVEVGRTFYGWALAKSGDSKKGLALFGELSDDELRSQAIGLIGVLKGCLLSEILLSCDEFRKVKLLCATILESDIGSSGCLYLNLMQTYKNVALKSTSGSKIAGEFLDAAI